MRHALAARGAGLSQLTRELSETVAVPDAAPADAHVDLQQRFLGVLSRLDGRSVDADTLFDVLRLEVLDWRLDNDIEPETLSETIAPPPYRSPSDR